MTRSPKRIGVDARVNDALAPDSAPLVLVADGVNKLRSSLTMLGITIGVFSVIGVMTVIAIIANADRAKLEPLMKLRRNRPLLLIDIAVPRDIDPEVNYLENVYLYNVDDLQTIANDYLNQRKEEIAKCEKIIAEKVKALLETARIADCGLEGGGLDPA